MKVKVFNKGFINNLFSAVVCDSAKWIYEGKSLYRGAIDKNTLLIFIMNHLYRLGIKWTIDMLYGLLDELAETNVIYYIGCCEGDDIYKIDGIM